MERPRPHPSLVGIRALSVIAVGFSVAIALEYYGGAGTFCSATGGCAHVRLLSGALGYALPAFGTLAFTTLFVLSLMRGRTFARITAVCAVCGALIAAYLIYVQSALGHWCWLCLTVDSCALAMGVLGGWLLARTPKDEARLGPGLVTFWWAPLWIAIFGPVIYGKTVVDPPIPEAIRELYDEAAEVNVVEMVDFECPYCRAMHPVLAQAIEGADARVHLVRVTVPLEFHPRARPASAAYYCAVDQGRGEAMADRLFGGELTDEALLEHARALGLDLEAFEACLDDEATEARIEEDLARYERAGGAGLPTVFIGERTYRGFAPGSGPEVFEDAIAAAARGEGRRIRYWPSIVLAGLLAASIALPLWVRRRK